MSPVKSGRFLKWMVPWKWTVLSKSFVPLDRPVKPPRTAHFCQRPFTLEWTSRSLWKYPEQKWWKKIKVLKSSFSNVFLSLSEDLLYYIGLIFHNRTIAHSVPRKWLLERNTLVELTLSTYHLTVFLFSIKKLLIFLGTSRMTMSRRWLS